MKTFHIVTPPDCLHFVSRDVITNKAREIQTVPFFFLSVLHSVSIIIIW